MAAVDQSRPTVERSVPPDAVQLPPRRRRPASAWALTLLAAVVAMLATYAAVREDGTFYLAAVASRDLPAGATFSPAAVQLTELRVAEEVAATVLLQEHLPRVEGWVLSQPVPAGGLVPRDALRAPSAPSRLRAMSLPIAADHAVAGAVERGDRVDVIEVRDDAAVYVATDLQVLAVDRPTPGPGGAVGGFTLTVAVDEVTALRLARALDSSAVHVVRATGATPATTGEGLQPRAGGLGTDESLQDGEDGAAAGGQDSQESAP